MQTISLLDFPIKSKKGIYVKFSDNFNIFLIKELRKHFNTYEKTAKFLASKGKNYGLNISPKRDSIYSWIKRKRFPIWVIKEICKKCKIPKKTIDKKVIEYGLWSPIAITKPKLPIKIDPIFISLIGNLLGDGCNSKKYSSLYYAQFRKEYAKIFADKIEHIFGKIDSTKNKRKFNIIKKRYYKGNIYEIKLPHFIGDILEKYAKTDNWYTSTSQIPEHILKENKESRIAFLSSLIIDEGCIVDGRVYITSINLNLIKKLKQITNSLCYKSKIYKRKNSKCTYYQLSIESISKLYKDLTNLKSQYKIITNFQKYKELGTKVKINNKIKQKNIKQKILRCLTTPKSVKKISQELLIREDKIRYHLYKLKKSNKVKKDSKNKVFGGYHWKWISSRILTPTV